MAAGYIDFGAAIVIHAEPAKQQNVQRPGLV